jgi:hypothetical protein
MRDDTSCFHNPIVHGVNYSLFIMATEELVLEEAKEQSGATLVLLSPPIFAWSDLSLPPSFVNAHGLIYIVYFRLKLIGWSHEEESGPPCRQDGWPYGLPCSFLIKLNIDFFFLSC